MLQNYSCFHTSPPAAKPGPWTGDFHFFHWPLARGCVPMHTALQSGLLDKPTQQNCDIWHEKHNQGKKKERTDCNLGPWERSLVAFMVFCYKLTCITIHTITGSLSCPWYLEFSLNVGKRLTNTSGFLRKTIATTTNIATCHFNNMLIKHQRRTK